MHEKINILLFLLCRTKRDGKIRRIMKIKQTEIIYNHPSK
jgi:hypothetical protein